MTDEARSETAPPGTEQLAEFGQLAVRSTRHEDRHTISLIGEMDIVNVGDVEQELIRVEATDAPTIVLDLSELTFMDSTGVRLLVVADARSRTNGNRLVLRRAPAEVMRVLQITGLVDRLPFSG